MPMSACPGEYSSYTPCIVEEFNRDIKINGEYLIVGDVCAHYVHII